MDEGDGAVVDSAVEDATIRSDDAEMTKSRGLELHAGMQIINLRNKIRCVKQRKI